VQAAGEKARTLREVPPAHALARNHPADGRKSKVGPRYCAANIPGGAAAPHYRNNTPSRASNLRFQFNPPEKPPSFLFAASTRWHGTRTGIGFAPHAPPTARTAFGLPMARAISP
jgi:hypothetical protein